MDHLNVDGYKVIFFVENILREFIFNNLPESNFNEDLLEQAKKTANENGAVSPLKYRDLLEYLHIGQLFDVIKSKKFQEIRRNDLAKIDISSLIRRRNTIMHSRYISIQQFEEIKETCEKVVIAIKDHSSSLNWNKFITEDIESYSVPLICVEYPLGKNFEKLIGREDELSEIKQLLARPFPISIIRHGGLGKTALVLQLVEDLLYSPQRPFEQIFFMSFKNSVFENGVVRRLEKVISNHTDLVNRLAFYMGISSIEKTFEDIQTDVWKNVFSKRTLLVLDNLETEIVQSNLSEFTRIADMFLTHFTHPSRLIITSRLGLGDSEKKYPLMEFDLERTKTLVSINVPTKVDILKKAETIDWEWVQQYTCGNPGLILSFCDSLRNSNKNIMDLRVEFQSKYSLDARQLYDAQDVFLEFCFANTTESLSKESQTFMAALSYLFSEASLKEVSEELLTFLIDEIGFSKLGFHNVKAQIFVNIGYLRPISGSNKYYVNELFVAYINGNYASRGDVFTVFHLKNSEWFAPLKQMVSSIIDLKYEEDLSVPQILSILYKKRFELTNNNTFLRNAFFCDPSLSSLLHYFEKSKSSEVVNNFVLLDKLKSLLLQNKDQFLQERIVTRLLISMSEINYMIKRGERAITGNTRQIDLFEIFQQMQNKISVIKTGNMTIGLRRTIVDFLIAINQLDTAEKYVQDYESQMEKSCFELFSKQIGIWAGRDKTRCERYISKCNTLITSRFIRAESKAVHYMYLARYYREDNPLIAYKYCAELDRIPHDTNTVFSFYLESLLLRAQCLLAAKKNRSEIPKFLETFNKEKRGLRYKDIQYKKRKRFEDNIRYLELTLKRQGY